MILFSKCIILFPLIFLIFPFGAGAGEARESYFMLIFAQEGESHEPTESHTFATFVKATGNGSEKTNYKLENHTISWLPASLDIRLVRFFPEKGTNLDLKSSLGWARSRNARISMWGPYQIKKELYQRAVRQVERLNRGAIAYKAIDRRFRPDQASNCFHAVSDIDTDNGLLNTGIAHGDEASVMVLRHLERWIIRPEEVHSWIADRLGLDAAIVRRRIEPGV
jgi:hypothetical protein